jgi:hypothetical protein
MIKCWPFARKVIRQFALVSVTGFTSLHSESVLEDLDLRHGCSNTFCYLAQRQFRRLTNMAGWKLILSYVPVPDVSLLATWPDEILPLETLRCLANYQFTCRGVDMDMHIREDLTPEMYIELLLFGYALDAPYMCHWSPDG